MEVHHHSHTERKKWTHYIWEFLMLFLAVFCGFLAENFREHQVEKQREKKYMVSMVTDLTDDTTRLSNVIGYCVNKFRGMDSLMCLLDKEQFSNSDELNLYEMYFQAIGVPVFLCNDRTHRQLISSGNMRLLNKTAVADSVIDYYGPNKDKTQAIVDDLKFYMNDLFLLSQNIFNYNSIKTNLNEDLSMKYNIDQAKMKVLTEDKTVIKKYINKNASCKARVGEYLAHLVIMKKRSIALLKLLKKEYHLK